MAWSWWEILRGLSRQPVPSTEEQLYCRHLDAAIAWIQRAAGQVHGGISKGYDLVRRKWAPAYPETTGYTIPTLLNTATARARPELAGLGLRLADYLLECSTPQGGVSHWQAAVASQPIVFDTGQVIFGWLAAFDASQDRRYLEAARRAGDWLVSIQDPSGAWLLNQHLGVVKVIDTRVAWALLELGQRIPNSQYPQSAARNLNWALARQHPDGWFEQCAFNPQEHPVTHTLLYTAEGFLECGLLLDEDVYLKAAEKTARALVALQKPDGSLAGTFGPGWQASSRWTCLTGNCQAARLWLRFYTLLGDPACLDAAIKAIRFTAGTQLLFTASPDLAGAIAGSYPVFGRYERFKLPNWAAKFFVDAILTLETVRKGQAAALVYKG